MGSRMMDARLIASTEIVIQRASMRAAILKFHQMRSRPTGRPSPGFGRQVEGHFFVNKRKSPQSKL